MKTAKVQLFIQQERGRFTLPVWVDHVGSTGTRYATGNPVERDVYSAPSIEEMPKIASEAIG